MRKLIKKFRQTGQIFFNVKVKTGMAKTEIVATMSDNTIKINLKAIPEKGKANTELIKYLAKTFKIDKKNVKIISGKSSSRKIIKIEK